MSYFSDYHRTSQFANRQTNVYPSGRYARNLERLEDDDYVYDDDSWEDSRRRSAPRSSYRRRNNSPFGRDYVRRGYDGFIPSRGYRYRESEKDALWRESEASYFDPYVDESLARYPLRRRDFYADTVSFKPDKSRQNNLLPYRRYTEDYSKDEESLPRRSMRVDGKCYCCCLIQQHPEIIEAILNKEAVLAGQKQAESSIDWRKLYSSTFPSAQNFFNLTTLLQTILAFLIVLLIFIIA